LSERAFLTKALPRRTQVARETAFARRNHGFCVSNIRGRLSEYSLNACVCLTVFLIVRHTRDICLNVVGMPDCAQAEHCLIRGQTQREATTHMFSITACIHALEQTRWATNILGASHQTVPATQMLRKKEQHHRRSRCHLSRGSRTLPPRVAESAAASAVGTADKKRRPRRYGGRPLVECNGAGRHRHPQPPPTAEVVKTRVGGTSGAGPRRRK